MKPDLNDEMCYVGAFFSIDLTELPPVDFINYLSVLMNFAESTKPLVNKYVGDMSSVRDKMDDMRKAQKIREVLAAGFLKNLQEGANGKSEDEN